MKNVSDEPIMPFLKIVIPKIIEKGKIVIPAIIEKIQEIWPF